MEPPLIRNAEPSELVPLARLWFEAWRDGHADIVPETLVRLRTLENFQIRLGAMLSEVRVIGELNEPAGFYALKGDELSQLFVSRVARGTGAAVALIKDAEQKLAAAGFETAWLACAIGNERAARFYEKSGWTRAGTFVSRLDTQEGVIPLEVWRYEKRLSLTEAPG